MKQAGGGFLHLLTLDGKPLAAPPPNMTKAEKLAYLAAKTAGQEMKPLTRADITKHKRDDGRRQQLVPNASAATL